MKKFLVLLGCLTILGASGARASVIDAPHNETNNVRCGDCHTYSIWWQYSPISASVVGRDTVTNAVCATCHSGNGTAPHKLGHSWSSMAEMHKTKNGSWQTNCVDCHNPHIQEQLDWLGSDAADLYLVTGSLGAGSGFSSGPGTTTLTYNTPIALTGWEDPTLWPAKNKTLPARGLLLVVDTAAATATYPIVAADANTITVRGAVAAEAGGKSFGLIYGQLIKNQVATPNSGLRPVKFFNPKNGQGGFTDLNTPAQGICQVCHTLTNYWTSNGGGSGHNAGTACAGCHETASGFKPIYAEHNGKIGSVATCVTCHKGANIVNDVHKAHCDDCHAGAPPALVARLATVTARPAVCSACHVGIATDFTTHPKALDHSGQVVANVEKCTGCHYHNKPDLINTVHKGQCSSCHNLNNGGVLQSLAIVGAGDCTNCHKDKAASFFSHPKANDHLGQVDAKAECAICHAGDPIWDVHSSNCGLCHKLPVGLLKGSALAGEGDCLTCHGDFFVHQRLAIPHTVQVQATAACVVCHTNPDLVLGIHATSGCQTCHTSLGTLIAPAVAGGGECATCHTDKVVGHPLINHMGSAYNYITPVASCVTCHQGADPVMDIHQGQCLWCHTAITQAAIHTLKPNLSAGDCAHCHAATRKGVAPDIGYSFSAHPKASDHGGQVEATVGCTNCHDGDPVWWVHWNRSCGTCHDINGVLQGSAVAGPGDCVHCHGEFSVGSKHMSSAVDNNHLATFVRVTPTCATYEVGGMLPNSCHNNPNPVLGIHLTKGCNSCHASTGTLVPAAVAGGGECVTCHAAYPSDNSKCLDCHNAHNRW